MVAGQFECGKCADSHLAHGREHLGVAVYDDYDREDKAHQRVEDEITVVAPRSLLPGQRARGLHTFWPIGAPAQQRGHSPEEAEGPDKDQANHTPPHAQLEASSWLADHIVAFVGEQGESAERHQACETNITVGGRGARGRERNEWGGSHCQKRLDPQHNN